MSLFFKSIMAGCSLLLITGCSFEKPALKTSRSSHRSTHPGETLQTLPQISHPTQAPLISPRANAGMELTKQARLLIEAGKPDEAIRFLERAVNLHPGSGENYYYLADAWLIKGNHLQAAEYNTLAAMRFKDNSKWMERIALQKKRIDTSKK